MDRRGRSRPIRRSKEKFIVVKGFMNYGQEDKSHGW